jgi:hypothetical protein
LGIVDRFLWADQFTSVEKFAHGLWLQTPAR